MTTLVTYALTTRQKVKDYLGITDTNSDTIIDQLINQATDFIESYCGGRRFCRTTQSEVYDAIGTNKIFLNQFPVTAVSEVAYNSGTPSTPIWSAYNVDTYLPYLNAGYIHFYGKLPKVPQGIRVTYTSGYLIDFTNEFVLASHTLPFDLTAVCTEIVAKNLNTRQSNGVVSMSTEGQSVTFGTNSTNISDDHKITLRKYTTMRYAI